MRPEENRLGSSADSRCGRPSGRYQITPPPENIPGQQKRPCQNRLEELLLIREFGFADPVQHLVQLLRALAPDCMGVLFHGAGNAVPFFAIVVKIDFKDCVTDSFKRPSAVTYLLGNRGESENR